jgi:hypothetical protein
LSSRSSTPQLEKSLLDLVDPWIPRHVIDVLITHPAGVGLVMIVAGAFMKQTHVPDRLVYPRDPRGDQIPGPPQTVKGSPGLDLLIWTVNVPVTVGDAAKYFDWIKALSSFGGLTGIFSFFMPDLKALESSNQPLKLEVYLSDVLVFGGAGMMGGQALSTLSNLVPKV